MIIIKGQLELESSFISLLFCVLKLKCKFVHFSILLHHPLLFMAVSKMINIRLTGNTMHPVLLRCS